MKNKDKNISIVLSISALMMLVSCQQQKAEWKGTIERENGVQVVKNPKEPMYDEDVFNLEEELTIGERYGREEYMFSRLSQLVINDQGDIYALDILENHIKIFNKYGKYLKTFGRRGQGPGEISGLPSYFTLSKQNELIVVDSSGISFFSLEGDFLRKIAASQFGSRVQIFNTNRNSNVYIYSRNSVNRDFELKKFDSKLNFLKKIEFSSTQGVQNIRKNGWNPFFPVLFCEFTEDDRIICGRNDKYEIRVYNNKVELEMRILKEYDPRKISQEDIEDYLEGFSPREIKEMNLPTYLPPFKYIESDEDGRIYISTFERSKNMNEFYYDVFNKKGMYLAKITLPSYPFIKDDMLYTWEEEEDGYQYIKRYKVTWRF